MVGGRGEFEVGDAQRGRRGLVEYGGGPRFDVSEFPVLGGWYQMEQEPEREPAAMNSALLSMQVIG